MSVTAPINNAHATTAPATRAKPRRVRAHHAAAVAARTQASTEMPPGNRATATIIAATVAAAINSRDAIAASRRLITSGPTLSQFDRESGTAETSPFDDPRHTWLSAQGRCQGALRQSHHLDNGRRCEHANKRQARQARATASPRLGSTVATPVAKAKAAAECPEGNELEAGIGTSCDCGMSFTNRSGRRRRAIVFTQVHDG